MGNILEGWKIDGKNYVIPIYSNPILMWWRASLLKEAGLIPHHEPTLKSMNSQKSLSYHKKDILFKLFKEETGGIDGLTSLLIIMLLVKENLI